MDASPTTTSPPTPADVPADVRSLLDELAAVFTGHDPGSLAPLLAADFLFQGMDPGQFLRHVRASFLTPRIDELRIVPTAFALDGDAAEVVAYAQTNLGLLPQAADLLPLVQGCRIVRRDGHWRLWGDRSPAPVGIYRRFRSITATLPADDVRLYRDLLAPGLDMPERPLVRLVATDYQRTTAPIEPYRVVQVQIACRFGSRSGWAPLSLPETSWIPVEGGRTLGYPKYIADRIVFDGGGDRWTARASNAAHPTFALVMAFEPDAGRAGLFERLTQEPPWAMVRRALPAYREPPWFLRMGGDQANRHPEQLLVRGDAMIYGRPRLRELFGRVRLEVAGDEPWLGLRRDWTEADGVLMEFAGRLNLGHRPAAGAG